jgi:hypothetical protein
MHCDACCDDGDRIAVKNVTFNTKQEVNLIASVTLLAAGSLLL